MILGFGGKIVQEFYCRHCPADDPNSPDPEKQKTGGHFRVRFSDGYDANIKIYCPKCDHQHNRYVKGGVLYDGSGRMSHEDVVRVPLAAWSREPAAKVAEQVKRQAGPSDKYLSSIRGGVVIRSEDDLSDTARAARATTIALYDPSGETGPSEPPSEPPPAPSGEPL